MYHFNILLVYYRHIEDMHELVNAEKYFLRFTALLTQQFLEHCTYGIMVKRPCFVQSTPIRDCLVSF